MRARANTKNSTVENNIPLRKGTLQSKTTIKPTRLPELIISSTIPGASIPLATRSIPLRERGDTATTKTLESLNRTDIRPEELSMMVDLTRNSRVIPTISETIFSTKNLHTIDIQVGIKIISNIPRNTIETNRQFY